MVSIVDYLYNNVVHGKENFQNQSFFLYYEHSTDDFFNLFDNLWNHFVDLLVNFVQNYRNFKYRVW